MSVVDLIGFAAGFFVVLTFYCTRAIPLRTCAVASNLLFLSYGMATGLAPIALLHAILLPLNLVRLGQAMGRNGDQPAWPRAAEAGFAFPSQNPPPGSRFWC